MDLPYSEENSVERLDPKEWRSSLNSLPAFGEDTQPPQAPIHVDSISQRKAVGPPNACSENIKIFKSAISIYSDEEICESSIITHSLPSTQSEDSYIPIPLDLSKLHQIKTELKDIQEDNMVKHNITEVENSIKELAKSSLKTKEEAIQNITDSNMEMNLQINDKNQEIDQLRIYFATLDCEKRLLETEIAANQIMETKRREERKYYDCAKGQAT